MKKILFVLMILVAVNAFGLDWYGFFFNSPPLNEEHEITGTVFDVAMYEGDVWAVILYTSYEIYGYFNKSPVMIWFARRPKVNDGDRVTTIGIYSGIWEYNGREVPTFRAVEE